MILDLGSFTGIRIGIATAKALANIISIPIIGVTSLEGLCYNVNYKDVIIALIDAKNNQVYCGIFDNNHNLILDYIADDINTLLPIFKAYISPVFIGDGTILHKNILDINDNNIDNSLHAKSIGICAYNKFILGIKQNADTVLPMYLRKSQAERTKLLNGQ